MLSSLAVAEPDVPVGRCDVSDGPTFDDTLVVDVCARLITEGLRMAPSATAPLVKVIFFYRNFERFFVI